jgi:hypothetical protein
MAEVDSIPAPVPHFIRWYCATCERNHQVKVESITSDTSPNRIIWKLGTVDMRCGQDRLTEAWMSKSRYAQGTKVRLEWPDGFALEAVVDDKDRVGMPGDSTNRWAMYMTSALASQAKITVLSTPRPQEPAEPGSVVWARMENPDNSQIRQWVKVPKRGASKQRWHDGAYLFHWDALHDVTLEDPFVDDLLL